MVNASELKWSQSLRELIKNTQPQRARTDHSNVAREGCYARKLLPDTNTANINKYMRNNVTLIL